MEFIERLGVLGLYPITSSGIDVIQANLGYRCNMACKHCHVSAGADRAEAMSDETIGKLLDLLAHHQGMTLDITGGAPELHPHFRYLIKSARDLCCRIIVRSNLTIFFEKGYEDLPFFLRDHAVEIVASLPYYLPGSVDRVRGNGAFGKSIEALLTLNSLGFGIPSSPTLRLNLVYNPAGAFLPPAQETLEEEYRRELDSRFGVSFTKLFTFVNMPIGRFREFLVRSNQQEAYLEKLRSAFNPETLPGIMCRHLINIGWDGTLYDCDFNQTAGLPVLEKYPAHLGNFDFDLLAGREIAFADHCYGCTAGQGST